VTGVTFCLLCPLGWDSGVGTATRYGLDGQEIGDRTTVGVRFAAPVQTGSGVNLASYTLGSVPLLGLNRPGRGFDHRPTSSHEVKERVELYIYSHSRPS